MHSFMRFPPLLWEQMAHWTKAMKNWEWNSGYIFSYIFSYLSSSVVEDYAVKADIDFELLPFIFGGPKLNKKNA